MAKYELVVIVDPFLSDEEQNAQIERFKESIVRRGGNVINVDVWGKRRLSYPIQKKQEGFYAIIFFEGDMDNEALSAIERALRLNEAVMRQLITRVPVPKPPKKEKPRKAPRASAESGGHEGRPSHERRTYYETRSAGDAGASAVPGDKA
ncbi:MAG: 30S ribosomal protein S6 [bacterium]